MSNIATTPTVFLRANDAAEIAQVNPRTIYRWVNRHNLGKKIGGTYRIDPEKLAAFLNGHADVCQSFELPKGTEGKKTLDKKLRGLLMDIFGSPIELETAYEDIE